MFELVSLVWWILIIPSLLTVNLIYIFTLAIDLGPPWFRVMVAIIYAVAWVLHITEAVIAYFYCFYVDEKESRFDWTLQTFLLGYPSLRLLLAKRK